MTVRVLIVEDTEHVRTMLEHVMDLHGFDVVGAAADGPEALRLAAETTPDVVVVDYRMPGMDGLETAQLLRADHPEVPVILYSAYLSGGLAERAERAGIAVCVPKTAGVEALGREIAALAMGIEQG